MAHSSLILAKDLDEPWLCLEILNRTEYNNENNGLLGGGEGNFEAG